MTRVGYPCSKLILGHRVPYPFGYSKSLKAFVRLVIDLLLVPIYLMGAILKAISQILRAFR